MDDLVVTQHILKTKRGELRYRARSGRIVLREEEVKKDVFRGWKARAEMSVTAYEAEAPEGADVTARPITFVFNGGPGSSSIWLHMGLLGPRRVDVGDVTLRTRRRTGSSTTPRRCWRSPTWSSSTRCRPGTRAPSRAGRRRSTTASARTSSRSPS